MTLDQWLPTVTGQTLSFDGLPQDVGQCVQLVSFYCRDVLGIPVYFANAVYWYTNFDSSPLVPNFQKIAFAGQSPNKGDIVIWNAQLPGSEGNGHIDVCLAPNASGFLGFDSNWGGDKTAHQVNHNYQYVLGYLRPKGDAMNEHDVKAAYSLVLHRDANDGEWQSWVGKAFLDFANAVAPSEEYKLQDDIIRNRYPNDEKVIADLRAQLASAGNPTQLAPGVYKV